MSPRDLDLALSGPVDGQQCEVVVDGLLLFRAAQIVVDTFLVFALRGDGRKPNQKSSNGTAQHWQWLSTGESSLAVEVKACERSWACSPSLVCLKAQSRRGVSFGAPSSPTPDLW